jgi:hypothetical protein
VTLKQSGDYVQLGLTGYSLLSSRYGKDISLHTAIGITNILNGATTGEKKNFFSSITIVVSLALA